MRNELRGKVMKNIVGLGVDTYSCLRGNGSEDKK